MEETIIVKINDASFEYDVRSLLRAFFPGADVEFLGENEGQEENNAAADLMIRLSDGSISQIWRGGEEQTASIAGLERAAVKNLLKCLIYDTLSADTGRLLPWGTLTGIRPTKLVLKKIREGAPVAEIHAFMRKNYRTSPEKVNLAYRIAQKEHRIIQSFSDDNTYSLYIGIPFCPSICLYCSFSSYPIGVYHEKTDVYLEALFREIDFVAEAFAGRSLATIYIGGGTPTSLSAEQLGRLLTKIRDKLDLSELREWTVEAGRPDSISEEKLAAIMGAREAVWIMNRQFPGIRISINPQTFQQATLEKIGRQHSTEDVERAFVLAREMGFGCINMDLIVGLPGETETEVADTLERVRALSPDNLTVHSLALKRASRLREELEQYADDAFRQSEQIMNLVHKAAAEMDMQPYYLYRQKDIAGNLENVGFAPEGKEGLYNILIMEEVQDIVALGTGAISKRVCGTAKPGRAANVKDVDQYIARIGEMLDRKRELFSLDK